VPGRARRLCAAERLCAPLRPSTSGESFSEGVWLGKEEPRGPTGTQKPARLGNRIPPETAGQSGFRSSGPSLTATSKPGTGRGSDPPASFTAFHENQRAICRHIPPLALTERGKSTARPAREPREPGSPAISQQDPPAAQTRHSGPHLSRLKVSCGFSFFHRSFFRTKATPARNASISCLGIDPQNGHFSPRR
jgi:hypothetical protein